jgi:hypothetical protein
MMPSACPVGEDWDGPRDRVVAGEVANKRLARHEESGVWCEGDYRARDHHQQRKAQQQQEAIDTACDTGDRQTGQDSEQFQNAGLRERLMG